MVIDWQSMISCAGTGSKGRTMLTNGHSKIIYIHYIIVMSFNTSTTEVIICVLNLFFRLGLSEKSKMRFWDIQFHCLSFFFLKVANKI